MWNFACTHKRLILASIKTLQFKEASPISSIGPSGNEVSTAIKCFILPPDN